jgi:hypothetical protein
VSVKHGERTQLLKTRQGKRWTEKDPTMQLNCSGKENKVLRQVWPFSFSAFSFFFLWAFVTGLRYRGEIMVTNTMLKGRGQRHDHLRTQFVIWSSYMAAKSVHVAKVMKYLVPCVRYNTQVGTRVHDD